MTYDNNDDVGLIGNITDHAYQNICLSQTLSSEQENTKNETKLVKV